MTTMIDISEIKQYTVALYREKFREFVPIGTGILVNFRDNYYLISAYHVFDMEEERLQVDNDPEEEGIPHDDMESIWAKGNGNEVYFCINDSVEGLVCTARYDQESSQPIFNEDTEWCVCKLSDKIVQHFTEVGKFFYTINDIIYSDLELGTTIVASGYPKYAQKVNQEKYRSFRSEMLECNEVSKSALFRVKFINRNAYNYENERYVSLPNDGIAGMSGGGLWYEKDNRYFPVGIILKQDPNNNYIEGFRLDLILKEMQANSH